MSATATNPAPDHKVHVSRTAPDLTRFARVPSAIVDVPQWTVWRLEPRAPGEQPTKIPYQIDRRTRAKSDTPATWAPYSAALEAYAAGGFEGITFMITPPFVGIDQDD